MECTNSKRKNMDRRYYILGILLLLFNACFWDIKVPEEQRDRTQTTTSTELPVFVPKDTIEYAYIPTLSSVRKTVVETLLSQSHVREATGRNDGVEVEMYLAATNLPAGNPWCAAYLYWAFHEAADTFHTISLPAFSPSWFRHPVEVVYQRDWKKTDFTASPAQVIGLYIQSKQRIGHVGAIIREDKNNYFTIEGNTNDVGSDEGDGVYKKIRPKSLIHSISDPLLNLGYE